MVTSLVVRLTVVYRWIWPYPSWMLTQTSSNSGHFMSLNFDPWQPCNSLWCSGSETSGSCKKEVSLHRPNSELRSELPREISGVQLSSYCRISRSLSLIVGKISVTLDLTAGYACHGFKVQRDGQLGGWSFFSRPTW